MLPLFIISVSSRHCAKHSLPANEVGAEMISSRQRLGEVHSIHKWLSWDLNPRLSRHKSYAHDQMLYHQKTVEDHSSVVTLPEEASHRNNLKVSFPCLKPFTHFPYGQEKVCIHQPGSSSTSLFPVSLLHPSIQP